MLNTIFWKKVQGQKHPGRWEIAECKIPSVKMLFKMNTNGHKHPSISLIIIEQDTVGEHRNCLPPKTSPIDCDGVQPYQFWNDTPCVCIYTSYNQNS